MVHWPEVMMTYEEHEHILFSADAFGSFGALNGHLFDDEIDFECGWMADTRRYYGNIVGKYGPQVQAALNKLSGVEIRMVCPLHGPFGAPGWTGCWTNTGIGAPIHRRNAPWAVFYGSMYGDTENAVNILTSRLAEAGVKTSPSMMFPAHMSPR